MYRFVSSVRLSWLFSSAIFSRRTSERLTQLRIPRRITMDASANRNEAMKPHCMRRSPYANAEVATSRAKIQKTIMAVLALYLRPAELPSASCNGPLPHLGPSRPRGEEEDDGDPGERDHVADAVRLGKYAAQGPRQEDPVAEPADARRRAHQRVLGPVPLLRQRGRAEAGDARGDGHAAAVGQHDRQVHEHPGGDD